jgi:hypothetical protein
MMAQGGLQLLLDQRNCWQQTIKLELFPHSKDRSSSSRSSSSSSSSSSQKAPPRQGRRRRRRRIHGGVCARLRPPGSDGQPQPPAPTFRATQSLRKGFHAHIRATRTHTQPCKMYAYVHLQPTPLKAKPSSLCVQSPMSTPTFDSDDSDLDAELFLSPSRSEPPPVQLPAANNVTPQQ